MNKEIVEKILQKEGMSLEDYNETVLVFVGEELLADSETLETASEMVEEASSYGEDAWYYSHKP